MRYTFHWDPNKAKENRRKHKITFERAAEVFLDPLAVSLFDQVHSEAEERWITLGADSQGKLLVVVHTFSEVSAQEWEIRVVSARKATPHETKQYREKRSEERI